MAHSSRVITGKNSEVKSRQSFLLPHNMNELEQEGNTGAGQGILSDLLSSSDKTPSRLFKAQMTYFAWEEQAAFVWFGLLSALICHHQPA